jgi:hypothetical protein
MMGGNFGGEFTESGRRAGGQIGRAGRRERFRARSCSKSKDSQRSLKKLGAGSISPPDFNPSAASFLWDSGRFLPPGLERYHATWWPVEGRRDEQQQGGMTTRFPSRLNPDSQRQKSVGTRAMLAV